MSMKLFFAGATLALSTLAAQAQVTLYEHCNYGGKAVQVPAGNFSLGSLQSMGLKNDDVSAVHVPAGYRVTLYEHAGFKGKSRTLAGSESCLVGANWNDILSSVRVENISANAGVNGQNVVSVNYASGAFLRSGPSWIEVKNDGALSFHFFETGRTKNKVSLLDPSRSVTIDLDLARNKVMYGSITGAKRELYAITNASAVDPTLDPSEQCVYGKFGVGYVANVRWYYPQQILHDPTTNTIALRQGARVYKDENVPVFGSSCVQTGHKMVASVSVIGGDFARDFVNVAIGTVVSAATGVAGAAVCVGSAGTACGLAVTGVATAVSTSVAIASASIPNAKGLIYFGAPKNVALTGTVFDAAATETR